MATIQYGARSGKSALGNSWASLSSTCIVEATQSKIQINGIHKVGPLEFLQASTCKEIVELYSLSTGIMNGINPFLEFRSPTEIQHNETSLNMTRLPATFTRIQLDSVLHELVRRRVHQAEAIATILTLVPETMVSSLRRLLSSHLDLHSQTWYTWSEYIGKPFEELGEDEQKIGVSSFQAWESSIQALYTDVVQVLLSAAQTQKFDDIEMGISKWRRLDDHMRGCSTHEEIFERERLVYKQFELYSVITWEKRRDLLNELITKQSLGLRDFVDTFLVKLHEADCYDTWVQNAVELFKLAKFKSIKPNHLNPRPPPVPRTNEDNRDSNLNDSRAAPVCKFCNYRGHTIEACRKRIAMEASKLPQGNERIHPSPAIRTESRTSTKFTKSFPPGNESRLPGVTENKALHTMGCRDNGQLNPTDTNGVFPKISVFVDSGPELIQFNGLLDTGSTLCYVSRSTIERINNGRKFPLVEEQCLSSVSTQTMHGTVHHKSIQRVKLSLSVMDETLRQSVFLNVKCLIYEGHPIPGGSDFLLPVNLVSSLRLHIIGDGNTCKVIVPPSAEHQSIGTNTSQNEDTCLHSIDVDPPEIVYDEFDFEETTEELALIRTTLSSEAISMGPLCEQALIQIRDRVHRPVLQLRVDPTQMEPPVKEFGFPAPRERQMKLLELLDTLERESIIRNVPRGSGFYLSPGYAVRKSGDRIRLVVRYCSLNDRLQQLPQGIEYHSTSHWKQSLPSWGTYYSVLDVKDAFYSIEVHPNSRKFLHMSIWTHDGFREYEWLKMPQGLSASPAHWCALIESIIRSLIQFLEADPKWKELLENVHIQVYVDDVLIAARDQNSCAIMTQIVQQVLSFNELYLPESKIQRVQQVVEIMGVKLSNGHVHPNDKTVTKFQNLRRPTSRKELVSALGLLNYVRWASPDRYNIHLNAIGVLYDLAKGKGKFSFSEIHENAWKILVDDFNGGLPLSSFSLQPGVEDVSLWSLVIQSDASFDCLGFCTFIIPKIHDSELTTGSLNECRLINVGHKRLIESERHYVPHDKEAYGIFWSLFANRFFIYLFGSVLLQTDNRTSASRYTNGPDTAPNTTRGRRWLRWVHDLSDILPMVHFVHLKGVDNNLADYLSRYILDDLGAVDVGIQTDDSMIEEICLTTFSTTATHPPMPLNEPISQFLRSGWNDDTSSLYIKRVPLYHIYNLLNNNPPQISATELRIIEEVCVRRFSLSDGFLIFNNNINPVIVVPVVKLPEGISLRTFLIRFCHEDSALSVHRGEKATISLLRKTFWWPGMDKDVSHWIRSCVPCVSHKSLHVATTFNPRKLQLPNQLLIADWAGPFPPSVAGYQYILLIVDAFTSYTMALKYRYKSAENTADALFNWISLFGVPHRWTSDNDSTFVAETISTLRSLMNIHDEVVPSYSPSTQGSVERAVRTLKEAFTTSLHYNDQQVNPIDWPTLIYASVFNSNCLERLGGLSPFELWCGRKPQDPLSVCFGLCSLNDSSIVDNDDYISCLRTNIQIIHDYWASKSMELKHKAVDNTCDGLSTQLSIGDRCVRISYVNGRRSVLGQVIVVSKHGSGSFMVRSIEGGAPFLVHGFQLIKVFDHPERIRVELRDTDPRPYYNITAVLDYDPKQGYLVSWEGYDEPSWQRPGDMPPRFRKRMAALRKTKRGSVVP